jgi:SAM-dependent methyltransferase
MTPIASFKSETLTLPLWFADLLNPDLGHVEQAENGILRVGDPGRSGAQKQTSDSFGFQWHKKSIFEKTETSIQVRSWLTERFGNPADHLAGLTNPVVLDAGCGASMSALAYYGPEVLSKLRYIGIDVSKAVDMAQQRFREAGLSEYAFVQSDLNSAVLKPGAVDIIFCEGVLHHTDDARKSFRNLCCLLKSGGRFIFYVYKKKAPIREFTDDFIRDALMDLSPEHKFNALLPLSKLGKTLGDLNIEVNIEEPVDVLGIPAGRINLQRLFFYYMFKCFYRSDWTLEQMNFTNFDWFSPQNCSRHTKEEVRTWIEEVGGMQIEKEYEDASGLSYIVKHL